MILKSLRLLPLLMLLTASPAMAQEEEGGLLALSGTLIFWTIVTFLIVLVALAKFAWPHILGAVEAREEHIRELLAGAARDREEAQALLEKQKAELEQMRTRAQEAFAESRAAGEQAREQLLAQARREQEEMLARAQREIHQQMDRALDTVRREAVDLAIAAAGKLVERNLDAEDNRRVVREYLGRMEQQSAATATAGV
jgi:F-type H+-transporting ATPase subunit b